MRLFALALAVCLSAPALAVGFLSQPIKDSTAPLCPPSRCGLESSKVKWSDFFAGNIRTRTYRIRNSTMQMVYESNPQNRIVSATLRTRNSPPSLSDLKAMQQLIQAGLGQSYSTNRIEKCFDDLEEKGFEGSDGIAMAVVDHAIAQCYREMDGHTPRSALFVGWGD